MIPVLDRPLLDDHSGRPVLAPAPPPAPRRSRRARAGAHRASLAVVAGLLAVAGAVHAWGMTRSPAPFDDEGTYVAQAWAVLERGQLAHYTYWYDHPPLGWLQIAGWAWLTDAFDRASSAIVAGRELMLVMQLASCALLYLLGRRLGLARTAAAVAVALFALSPLAVGYHRMVLLDNVATPWVLGAFVLACSPERRLWAYAASGACLAAAVLTKETNLLLLPALVMLLRSRTDRRTRRFCLTAFAAAFVLAGLVFPLGALLKGELVPGADRVSLVDAVRFQLVTRASTGSVFDPSSTAHRVVGEWADLDPWLVGVGVALVPVALFVPRLRWVAVALATLVLAALRGGYLPVPFVIAFLPFAALVVAGVADALWRGEPSRRRRRAPRPSKAGQVGTAVRRVAVLGAVLVAGAFVAPAWAVGDVRLATVDEWHPVTDAERWVEDNVERDAHLLVDDTLWVDLVEAGFDPERVVWFYKLDFANNLDPSVARRLPDGWRHFDYVVLTPTMRSGLEDLPGQLTAVREAIDNSTPVASFGANRELVEVRRIRAEGR